MRLQGPLFVSGIRAILYLCVGTLSKGDDSGEDNVQVHEWREPKGVNCNLSIYCEILGSCGSEYEDESLLG
jgi:hypothetical protein